MKISPQGRKKKGSLSGFLTVILAVAITPQERKPVPYYENLKRKGGVQKKTRKKERNENL